LVLANITSVVWHILPYTTGTTQLFDFTLPSQQKPFFAMKKMRFYTAGIAFSQETKTVSAGKWDEEH